MTVFFSRKNRIWYVIINSNRTQEIMAGQIKKPRYSVETSWFSEYYIGFGISNCGQKISKVMWCKDQRMVLLAKSMKHLSGYLDNNNKLSAKYVQCSNGLFVRWMHFSQNWQFRSTWIAPAQSQWGWISTDLKNNGL